MKIKIYAKSGDYNTPTSVLNGIGCDDNFAEYCDPPLSNKLKSGYMRFEEKDGELYTVTEYDLSEALTDSEIKELISYTQGQWSDGIGEGFEQVPCAEHEGEEVYVSPWYRGQICQYEIYD